MNYNWLSILFRFVLLVALQILVFKRIPFEYGILSYSHIFIYPLWVMLLPFKTPKSVLLIAGFFMGMTIDIFYQSYGVHAAALVFSAYIRDFIFRIIEPDIGYDLDEPFNIKRLGVIWYLSYSALFLLLHLFVYFSVEVFSFVYFYEIMVSTITSLLFSLIIVFIFVLIFNPKS